MTKMVRIENADTNGSVNVLVQVCDKGYPAGSPDVLSREELLAYPTRMVEVGITETRYLVVKEVPNPSPSTKA